MLEVGASIYLSTYDGRMLRFATVNHDRLKRGWCFDAENGVGWVGLFSGGPFRFER
jgi:hypothetical protein